MQQEPNAEGRQAGRHTAALYWLAERLVHQVGVVDLDDALVLLKQALLPWTTLLLHTSDVQTQGPDMAKAH